MEKGNPSAGATGRQCTATSKRTGERCKRPPIEGGTVCWHHGGAAPQVVRAAKIRLMMASDPLAAELIRIAQSKNTSDADKIKAINSVLDRAEVRAGLDVSLKEDPKYIQILKDLFNESEEDDSEPGPGPEPTPSTSDDDVVDRLLKDVDPDADPTHAPYRGQPVPLAEPELPYGPPPFGQYVPRSAYDRR